MSSRSTSEAAVMPSSSSSESSPSRTSGGATAQAAMSSSSDYSPSRRQQQQQRNSSSSTTVDETSSVASTTSSCGEESLSLLCSDDADGDSENNNNNNNNNHHRNHPANDDSEVDDNDNDDGDRIEWTTTKPGSSSLKLSSSSSPSSKKQKSDHHHHHHHHHTTTAGAGGSTKAMSGEQVKKEESKTKKIMTRVVAGVLMFGIFAGSVYSGHLYVCAVVALIEFLLFRELVRVRYSAFYKSRISQNRIPLFRTTQWMWFCLAIFCAYGDFLIDILQNNAKLHYLLHEYIGIQYFSTISFCLYSATFVVTIATLQRKHIKFQINQLCWTVLVLCLTVGQLKYVMHNIFNGLIWYVLPCCLVFVNDIMAYVAGMTCGRKFISRPFIKFSPNKTWEGFIGGAFFTLVTAWYLSRFLAQSTWMTCPTNEFTLALGPTQRATPLSCQLDPIFQPAQSILPASQILEFLPRSLLRLRPLNQHVIDICSFPQTTAQATAVDSQQQQSTAAPIPEVFPHVGSSSGGSSVGENIVLGKCLSSPADSYETPASASSAASSTTTTTISYNYDTQVHHHYEFIIRDYYPIQFHALWLALFASLVAPFGGFFASAMKRAYGIKDFDSILPGHGGVMDRMDCQFLMALCTWVHYNTFVKLATISVPKLTYMYSLLSEQEKADFLQTIGASTAGTTK